MEAHALNYITQIEGSIDKQSKQNDLNIFQKQFIIHIQVNVFLAKRLGALAPKHQIGDSGHTSRMPMPVPPCYWYRGMELLPLLINVYIEKEPRSPSNII